MYNYFMLVGFISAIYELKELPDGKKVINILLSVRRDFKDMNGEYVYDKIKVTMWDFLAEMVRDNLKKGARIGLKGRITPKLETLEGGQKAYVSVLTADKVIFFDDRSTHTDNNEDDKEQFIEE